MILLCLPPPSVYELQMVMVGVVYEARNTAAAETVYLGPTKVTTAVPPTGFSPHAPPSERAWVHVTE